MDRIPSRELRKLVPDDVEGLDLVSEWLSISLAHDIKHGRDVHYERDLVVRMCQKSEGRHLGFKGPPGGLGPDHNVIVLIANRQKVMQPRPHDFHQWVVECFAIDQCIVQIQYKQPLSCVS